MVEEKHFPFLLFFLLLPFLHHPAAISTGTSDGSELWGYTEVRTKAHLFWWLYRSPYRVQDPTKPWPTILWLQGGPGASGVGLGNFLEIGPLDSNLKTRNQTWLHKADLLFVDSPVGTGFSYVEDESLVVKTDYESAADLTTLLIELSTTNEDLQKNPFYIFAESYGGKFAVTLAVTALEAIQAGKLKLQLAGVALGDSWISPEDFVFSWGPLLKDVSRIDNSGLEKSNSLAMKIKQQLAEGKSKDATSTWRYLEGVVQESSNNVDFYNFMLDDSSYSAIREKNSSGRSNGLLMTKYHGPSSSSGTDFGSFMNGPIKQKLQIIPPEVSWGGQSDLVFTAMEGDFMNPRIEEVDKLLNKDIKVTIYNGQLDLICATKGTESWVGKLKWDGLKDFFSVNRTPLYCGNDKTATKGFVASYRNLHFYWILGAGHMVPIDQPCVSLDMVGTVTQSPSVSS